ncbi:MAG: hypothetical protein ACYDGR_07455 [Candidatus Dormibacteria bacterium]
MNELAPSTAPDAAVTVGPRVGITRATELPLRFRVETALGQ